MWDGLLVLILLCIIMAGASFGAGILPLSFSLSSRQLRLITALGTGVLVGTSLIVIIPEGVETLYSASDSSHGGHAARSSSLAAREATSGPDAIPWAWKHDTWRLDHITVRADVAGSGDLDSGFNIAQEHEQDRDENGEPTGGHNDQNGGKEDSDQEHGSESHHDPHAWVGVSLITGFILMYLIDTLPRHASTSSQPQRFHISLNQFSFNRSSSMSVEEPPTPTTHGAQEQGQSRPSSTTVGLVIHAAADGIALGASSTTSSSNLSFIIFLALMLHKAPAAFGLTSVLLKQGLSKRAARAHLIVFSLAAPVGALLTWSAAHLLGYSTSALSNSVSTEFATGVLLLFSGGTFLYVAMHTMQENGHEGHDEPQGNGYAGVPMDMYSTSVGPAPKAQKAGNMTDTVVCVAGMLIPLLTQVGHAH